MFVARILMVSLLMVYIMVQICSPIPSEQSRQERHKRQAGYGKPKPEPLTTITSTTFKRVNVSNGTFTPFKMKPLK